MKLIISVLFLATGVHCGFMMNTKAQPVRSSIRAASPCLSIRIAGASAGCATLLLGWAFQGVGPSPEAKAAMDKAPPTKVGGLRSALLFGGATPTVALYCGAKVRPESYAPLALAISEKLEAEGGSGGVLVLQSPFNVYAFKPATVAKVLDAYPSITCVAGHSIGGLWAAEFCRDLHEAGAWPGKGLDFFYMGVHGKGISLEQFGTVPFRKVGWSWASEDVTMQRAAAGDVQGYVARNTADLPEGGRAYEIAGGNHEQYGSYGSPGLAQGLAYKDLPATISAEAQCELLAAAIAETALRG